MVLDAAFKNIDRIIFSLSGGEVFWEAKYANSISFNHSYYLHYIENAIVF